MLLGVVFANLDIGWCCGRLQSVRRYVVLVSGDERKRQRRSEGRGGGEEKARVLDVSAAEKTDALTTHSLALLHQTRPACSYAKRPDGADPELTRALLPQLLTRAGSAQLVTKLAPLGPNELPHVQFSKPGQGLRSI